MKIRLTRQFSYQVTPTKTVTHERGVVDLPERYALAALRQRAGVRIDAEKPTRKKLDAAPENKARKGSDDKARVGKKTSRRRGTGSKS